MLKVGVWQKSGQEDASGGCLRARGRGAEKLRARWLAKWTASLSQDSWYLPLAFRHMQLSLWIPEFQ